MGEFEVVSKIEYYQKLYDKAVEVATEAHEGQTRWGGEPYITHPLAVSDAFSLKDNPREKIAAVLHDVLEDSDTTSQDLMKTFPVEIVEALVILTHAQEEAYADYIMRIRGDTRFPRLENLIAIEVKLADLDHNLSDLDHPKKHKQRRDKYQLARKLLTL